MDDFLKKFIFDESLCKNEGKIKEIWDNAIFVFDTNILLKIYEKKDYKEHVVYKTIKNLYEKDMLFFPYKVVQEFLKNGKQMYVIRVIKDKKDKNTNEFNKCMNDLKRIQNDKINLNKLKEYLEVKNTYFSPLFLEYKLILNNRKLDLKKGLEKELAFLDKIYEELTLKTRKLLSQKNDEILNELIDMFKNKIGKNIETDIELPINVDLIGYKRYKRNVPPGYRDKSKRGDGDPYGDLIIWLEIIEYAKKNKKDIVFVTDDKKNDWYDSSSYDFGENINKHIKPKYPRPKNELLFEFSKKTKKNILIFTFDEFNEIYIKLNKDSGVTEKDIEEYNLEEIENRQREFNEFYEEYQKFFEKYPHLTNIFKEYFINNSFDENFTPEKLMLNYLSRLEPRWPYSFNTPLVGHPVFSNTDYQNYISPTLQDYSLGLGKMSDNPLGTNNIINDPQELVKGFENILRFSNKTNNKDEEKNQDNFESDDAKIFIDEKEKNIIVKVVKI